MTAKIEWYREVLELEPNSKVFFPLARLLAEEGNEDEAMALLEKGLERHPEYLEARLFRIELLYKACRKEECNVEIGKLSKMFASYAGFWQAWAACLASSEGQADTASLLRFLAAHFVSGPLQLHDVLNRGLDAMIRDGALPAPEPVRTQAAPSPTENFAQHSREMLADLDQEPGDSVSETPLPASPESELLPATEPEAMQAEAMEMAEEADLDLPEPELTAEEPALPEPEPEILPATEPEPMQAEAMEMAEEAALDLPEPALMAEEPALPEPEPEILPATEPEPMQAEAMEMAEEAALDLPEPELMAEEPALPEPEPELLPATEPEPMQAEAMEIAEEAALDLPEPEPQKPAKVARTLMQAEEAMVDGLDLPDMDLKDIPVTTTRGAKPSCTPAMAEATDDAGEDFQEEPFSLRTRSMAEVLAEQGDIQGALDIYRELAEAATSADEAEDINRRIATLSARLSLANASPNFRAADDEAVSRSKEKLIGMLEALAQGMEARANS